MGGKLKKQEVSIASGASLATEIDLRLHRLVAIQMPADWTTANLTFSAREDTDGTVQSVVDSGGTEVSITAAADVYIVMLDADRIAVDGLAYTTIRSGTAATPVNQTADRTLWLILEPRS